MGQSSSILETTWSATQAAISVILVLLFGYLARHYGVLSSEGEKGSSHISVTIFLPCLLFSQIGPLASWSNLQHYWIIIVYSLLFQLVSYAFGEIGVRLFKMPQWLTPCMVFNNATSLPLLLLNTLGKNHTLDPLMQKGDALDDLLQRGRVYLLINALIGNLTRFTFGPYMLRTQGDDAHAWSHSESPHLVDKVKNGLANLNLAANPAEPLPTSYPAIEPYPSEAETTPLLHSAKVNGWRGLRIAKLVWKKLAVWVNPPMAGGIAAVLVGVVPFLHRWFFEEDEWLSPLAQALENLGDLYTVLQMFVLGAHLKAKRGSKLPPLWTLAYLFLIRFAVIPVMSAASVYGVRTWLGDRVLPDPILDFTMILAPVGPPAITLAAIVEMTNADASTDTAVAQTIVLSYVMSPLISLSVTGSLAVVRKLYGQ